MSANSYWSRTTSLGPLRTSAAAARRFVCVELRARGHDELVEDLETVASELATNVIRHEGNAFSVTLEGDDVSVLLTVRQSAPLVDHVVQEDLMAEGGRGLLITEILSDMWGVSERPDGTTAVWASFTIGAGA